MMNVRIASACREHRRHRCRVFQAALPHSSRWYSHQPSDHKDGFWEGGLLSAHTCHPTAQLQYLHFFPLREYRHACDVDPTISTPDLAPVLVALPCVDMAGAQRPSVQVSKSLEQWFTPLPRTRLVPPPFPFAYMSSLTSKVNEMALVCSASACLSVSNSRARHSSASVCQTAEPGAPARVAAAVAVPRPPHDPKPPRRCVSCRWFCPCTRACTSQIPDAFPFIPSFPTVSYAPPAGHRPPLAFTSAHPPQHICIYTWRCAV